jgi:hypothetical protein
MLYAFRRRRKGIYYTPSGKMKGSIDVHTICYSVDGGQLSRQWGVTQK